jgi:hypothetical protein
LIVAGSSASSRPICSAAISGSTIRGSELLTFHVSSFVSPPISLTLRR